MDVTHACSSSIPDCLPNHWALTWIGVLAVRAPIPFLHGVVKKDEH